MKPDGRGIIFMHQFNNNTWGLGFNESGDVFGSTANNNPAFFGGFPESGYAGKKGLSAKMIADSAAFHPITPNVRQVDVFGGYTAGAGYAFATSKNFPESWRNEIAFISGPTGNLLGAYRNVSDGSGYRAINNYSIVASADEWFSPVAAEVGPDGNLWIADWYNFIIQHNPTPTAVRGGYDAANGTGNAHVNPNRDRQHGRIYRLVWEGAEDPEIQSLADAATRELVGALKDSNMFWRLTAQRLLVENNAAGTADTLRQLLQGGGVPAVHAFWTLRGLGLMDDTLHQMTLLNRDPGVRKAAASALSASPDHRQMLIDSAILTDSDLGVRRVAFTALAHLAKDPSLQSIIRRLYSNETNREDTWLSIALKAAAANQGIHLGESILGPNLVLNGSFEDVVDGTPRNWILSGVKDYGDSSVSFDGVLGETKPRSGDRLFTIDSDDRAEYSWATKVQVNPNTDYRLAGWIHVRALREGNGVSIGVNEVPGLRSETLRWRTPWRELEVFFNSGEHREMTLSINYGGGRPARGTVSFDDFSLSEVLGSSESEATLIGDATRGRNIFYEHEMASCTRCHQVRGEGGAVGPALDEIASKQTDDYLRESLVYPQATIAKGFPVELSPMPPFGVLLSSQELEDVLAYLKTLN